MHCDRSTMHVHVESSSHSSSWGHSREVTQITRQSTILRIANAHARQPPSLPLSANVTSWCRRRFDALIGYLSALLPDGGAAAAPTR